MKVGAIHFSKTNDVKHNMERLLELNFHLAERGAELIVNPELSIWPDSATGSRENAMHLAREGREIVEIFRRKIAACYSNYVLLGIVEFVPGYNALFNSAALVGRDGIVCTYRKRFLTRDAIYACRGDSGFMPAQISPGRVGALVCADYSLPLISRCLALNGSEIIAILAKLSGKTTDTLQARAMENGIPLVLANSWEQYGPQAQSAIVSANGKVLESSDALSDEVLFADLAKNSRLEAALQRRPNLYHGALLDLYPVLKYAGKADIEISVYTISGHLAGHSVHALLDRLIREKKNGPAIFVLPELDVDAARIDCFNVLANSEISIVCGCVRDGCREISLFSRQNSIHHRKTHLAAGEKFQPGDSIETFFELPFGKISILFGHELLFPEVVEAHVCQGVDLILACANLDFDASPLYRDIASRHIHLAVAESHFFGGVFSRYHANDRKESWLDEKRIYPGKGRCELPYLKYGMEILVKKGGK